MSKLKKIIKAILPKVIIDFFIGFFYGWKGNYPNWEAAKEKSTGYNVENILEKVKFATLKVKNDKASYERDSVLFYEEEYVFPLLTSLFWVSTMNSGKLHVLDFGGSLGSTYFQNKKILEKVPNLKWCIVEQKNYVNEGIASFQNEQLKFYYTIDDCIQENQIDIVLLSSVLQYLEKPYELLDKIFKTKFKYILIDRTPFVGNKDRITVQKVHPKIYKAKYPCWFFEEEKFKNYIMNHCDLIFEFESLDRANIMSKFKGFLFELKNKE